MKTLFVLQLLLGKKATDCVTDISGVVTSITFDLYGCVQALLTRQEDGKERSDWYDINRLKFSPSEEPVMPCPDFETILAKYDGGESKQDLSGPANKPIP